MKKYKKILIDAILFFVIIGLTLYGVFHGEDLSGLKDAIKECALAIESDAKRNCPVDTGRLRMSITSETSNINDFEASVGTNVEYATHVEYGTHKQSPKPYLRPAYNKNVAKLQTKINKVLGGK